MPFQVNKRVMKIFLLNLLFKDDVWITAQLKTEGKVVTIEAIQESGSTEPSYVAIDDVFFKESDSCDVEPPEANVGQDCENLERCNDGGFTINGKI